jgi:hypothetical protein
MELLTAKQRRQLDHDGYLAFECIVERTRVEAMRVRLEELLAVTPQDHAGTLIVRGLQLIARRRRPNETGSTHRDRLGAALGSPLPKGNSSCCKPGRAAALLPARHEANHCQRKPTRASRERGESSDKNASSSSGARKVRSSRGSAIPA